MPACVEIQTWLWGAATQTEHEGHNPLCHCSVQKSSRMCCHLAFGEVLEEAPRGVCCKPHLLKVHPPPAMTVPSVLWGGFCWAVRRVGIDKDKVVYVI